MMISEKNIRRHIRSLLKEAMPTRSNVEYSKADERDVPINRLGKYKEYVTSQKELPGKYIRVKFDVNNYSGEAFLDTKTLRIQTPMNISSVMSNAFASFLEWFKDWTAFYDSVISDGERIHSIIFNDSIREKYQKEYGKNLKEQFDHARQAMKDNIRIMLTQNPDTGSIGSYSPSEDDLIVQIYEDGKIDTSTAEHEFQHRHDELFNPINRAIAKVTGNDIRDATSYKHLDSHDPHIQKTLAYSSHLYDEADYIAQKTGDKNYIESELRRFSRKDFNLPDLDYIAMEDMPAEYSDEAYYYRLFYNLKRDHLEELVQRLAYLSDALGNSELNNWFLGKWLSGSLEYPPDPYGRYDDVKDVALVLKNTDKNKKFFKRYGNIMVKKSKSDDTVTT